MSDNTSQDGLEKLGFFPSTDSHVLALRAVNEQMKSKGLYLTESGLHDVLAARQGALARQARLEWSLDMTEKILERAASSPYAEKDTLPQVVADWYEVILYIQNQTSDFIADDDLVRAVSEYYDNYCAGDADLLRGKAADRILSNYKLGKELIRGAEEQPGRANTFDDEEPAGLEEEPAPKPHPDDFHSNIFAIREPQKIDSRVYAELDEDDAPDLVTAAKTSVRHAPVRRGVSEEEKAHEMLRLFQRELSHYVGEGATSVSESTGRGVFASIQYTLALASDTDASIEQRFYEGQHRLLTLLKEAEDDLRYLLAHRIRTPLETYHNTLTRELPDFFRLYDAQYRAHETPSLMDYPLANDMENTSGVLYIHEYLRRLRYETEYVSRVTDDFCCAMVLAYGRKYDLDIRPVPVNLFDILMVQAFAVALLTDATHGEIKEIWGDGDRQPDISEWLFPREIFTDVLAALTVTPEEKRLAHLTRVSQSACQYPGVSCPESIEYARTFAGTWAPIFEQAIKNKCPENLVLFKAHIPPAAEIVEPEYFVEETPMPDSEYRELIEKLSTAESVQSQHRMIRKRVHSRRDLLDILDEDFWIPGEKEAFLNTFTPEERLLLEKEEDAEPRLGRD
jgi:hypothetical protein